MKAKILASMREGNKGFYGMVVAQALKIELVSDSLVFTFAPTHKTMKPQLEAKRSWVEGLAQAAAGRKINVVAKDGEAVPVAPAGADPARDAKNAGLKARAKAEPTVQAMLDVFGGEIEAVEEIE